MAINLLIDGKTTTCGLFGYPVVHSFSPPMHNAAFQKLNLNWVYVPFAVEPQHLPQAVLAVRALKLAGVNLTVPHKETVLPLLDELSPAAKAIGAVNVIINEAGKLTGHNTDGAGFTRAIKTETSFTAQGKRIIILGAGGAARAVAVQLSLEGAIEIVLVNRTVNRAEKLAQTLRGLGVMVRVLTWEQPEVLAETMLKADLIVQATSTGMHPNIDACLPLPLGCFQAGQIVCDLVYNPVQTKFLRTAQTAGATTVSGLGMLLYQGVQAFEMWTKKTAPVDVMKQVLYKQKLIDDD